MLVTIISLKDSKSGQAVKTYNTINSDTLVRDLRIEFKDPEKNVIAENTGDYEAYISGYKDTESQVIYQLQQAETENDRGELLDELIIEGKKIKSLKIIATSPNYVGNVLKILQKNKIEGDIAKLIDAKYIAEKMKDADDFTKDNLIFEMQNEIIKLKEKLKIL